MIKTFQFVCLFFLCTIFGCGPEIVFEQSANIEKAQWEYSDLVDFKFEAPNLDRKYNLLLTVMHSKEFAYQNTYVKVHTTFPSGKKNEQTLSLNLSDKMGNWMGNCNSTICSATIALQLNTKFEEAGSYQITLEQDSRENPLNGIHSLTFQIEAVEKS